MIQLTCAVLLTFMMANLKIQRIIQKSKVHGNETKSYPPDSLPFFPKDKPMGLKSIIPSQSISLNPSYPPDLFAF